MGLEYGFRHDPMDFVENSDSLQAALVRRVVFDRPSPGDEDLIEQHFAELFEEILGKMVPEQPPATEEEWVEVARGGGGQLVQLLEKGCPRDHPDMQRVIEAARQALGKLERPEDADMGVYALRGLCELGITDSPAVAATLRKLADNLEGMLGWGCPWTPCVQLNALWAGREVADLDEAIQTGLEWLERSVQAPGCSAALGLCDPTSLLQLAGAIDHPIVERIARGLVPMLLRWQQPDGSWGADEDRTFWAFRALKKHGLLEELRDLPPLPPDWEVVRSIASPCEKPRNITFAEGTLWVLDNETWQASALSPEDGSVLRTVQLPRQPGMTGFGFAASDGAFHMTAVGKRDERPPVVYEIDADTGEIARELTLNSPNDAIAVVALNGQLLVGDGWEGMAWLVDPADSQAEPQHTRLASGMPDYMTSDGQVIWALDGMAPALVKTNLHGELLDWTEQPFGFNPVAWDGEHLWALDPENSRICLIEKAR